MEFFVQSIGEKIRKKKIVNITTNEEGDSCREFRRKEEEDASHQMGQLGVGI